MNLSIENIILIGSGLLLMSIIAGKATYKLGIPTLLLFLTIGMLAGSDGLIGIHFDDPKIAQFIGIVSLNFILFSGGLDTSWETSRRALWHGISLSTAGVLFTALLTGVFVYYITELSLYEGLLLGAIVSSTDAAAVFSILRSKSVALKGNTRAVLEMESGSNDPMAYVLTIAFLSLVQHPEKSITSVIPLFFQQMLVGGIMGYLFGRISTLIINRIQLDFEGLYPVLTISLMFITFSLTDFIGGNGFLAIYICAVYLGNQDFIHKKTILKIYDGLAWLMQIVLFLTLGLLVYPHKLIQVMGVGMLISIFMIIVARPIAVLIALLPFRMKLRRKLFISWVGLRGAVPIVFATYPLLAGVSSADYMFNIVFFVSLTSVLIQGTTLDKIAHWLHVALPEKMKPLNELEKLILDIPKENMEELVVPYGSAAIGEKIVELGLPRNTIIAIIRRDGKYMIPNGSTVLQAGDKLYLLAEDQKCLQKAKDILLTPLSSKQTA